MRISIRVYAYVYTRICVCLYAYVRIKMRIHPYAHIRVCSLVCMSLLIVFLLSAGYCSKEKLDSTKKLNDYERHEDFSRNALRCECIRVR